LEGVFIDRTSCVIVKVVRLYGMFSKCMRPKHVVEKRTVRVESVVFTLSKNSNSLE
jgi:hypothetical protein